MPLLVHHSISDLFKALNLPLEQELDFTIHSLPDMHPEVPFKSPVFRAEYFSFVFVKSGEGSYTIDDQEFPFEDRTIYFTNPGHIKAFHIRRADEAYIITLTERFLRENVHPAIFEEFPFLLAETVPPKSLSPDRFAEFEGMYQQIWTENQMDSPYKQRILGNLFVVLLLKIKAYFWQDYDPIAEGDRNSQIVRAFKQGLEKEFGGLLETDFSYQFRVQDYAEAQHLHPDYFNQVIKSKTGKTAHQWISDRLVSSARSLLRNTDLSIKEISYRCGYSEPNHFSRFFKQQTGQTPRAFRKGA